MKQATSLRTLPSDWPPDAALQGSPAGAPAEGGQGPASAGAQLEGLSRASVQPDAFGLLRLEDICDKYLGICFATARRRYAEGRLPVRAFRLNSSRRGPLYVHVDDLEKLIARRRSRAPAPLPGTDR